MGRQFTMLMLAEITTMGSVTQISDLGAIILWVASASIQITISRATVQPVYNIN